MDIVYWVTSSCFSVRTEFHHMYVTNVSEQKCAGLKIKREGTCALILRYGAHYFEYNRYTWRQSGTTVDWCYIPGSADCCDATMPGPFCRKAVIWIVTHTLAFAIGVQLSIVMLWGISFWHDGKLVVIVHVIIIILQLVGYGQGLSVGGYGAKHARTYTQTNEKAQIYAESDGRV